jgi:pyruvate dehydrogenase (quinone)
VRRQQLVGVLRQAGVERVYGVVGDSLNPVVDAIRGTDGIDWVDVRNEEAGAFAPATAGSRRRAALVDLVTDPNALSIPPHISADQVKGFALAAGKIMLEGGVGKMIEMARSNLRNVPRPALARR